MGSLMNIIPFLRYPRGVGVAIGCNYCIFYNAKGRETSLLFYISMSCTSSSDSLVPWGVGVVPCPWGSGFIRVKVDVNVDVVLDHQRLTSHRDADS